MPRRAVPPNGPLEPLTRRRVVSLDTGDVGEGERPSVGRAPDEGDLAPEWAHGGVGVGGHCFQQQPCRDGSLATGVIATLVNPKVIEVDLDVVGRHEDHAGELWVVRASSWQMLAEKIPQLLLKGGGGVTHVSHPRQRSHAVRHCLVAVRNTYHGRMSYCWGGLKNCVGCCLPFTLFLRIFAPLLPSVAMRHHLGNILASIQYFTHGFG